MLRKVRRDVTRIVGGQRERGLSPTQAKVLNSSINRLAAESKGDTGGGREFTSWQEFIHADPSELTRERLRDRFPPSRARAWMRGDAPRDEEGPRSFPYWKLLGGSMAALVALLAVARMFGLGRKPRKRDEEEEENPRRIDVAVLAMGDPRPALAQAAALLETARHRDRVFVHVLSFDERDRRRGEEPGVTHRLSEGALRDALGAAGVEDNRHQVALLPQRPRAKGWADAFGQAMSLLRSASVLQERMVAVLGPGSNPVEEWDVGMPREAPRGVVWTHAARPAGEHVSFPIVHVAHTKPKAPMSTKVTVKWVPHAWAPQSSSRVAVPSFSLMVTRGDTAGDLAEVLSSSAFVPATYRSGEALLGYAIARGGMALQTPEAPLVVSAGPRHWVRALRAMGAPQAEEKAALSKAAALLGGTVSRSEWAKKVLGADILRGASNVHATMGVPPRPHDGEALREWEAEVLAKYGTMERFWAMRTKLLGARKARAEPAHSGSPSKRRR